MQSEVFEEVLRQLDTPWGRQLESHEGFESKIYKDNLGYDSIGFGTNLALGISKEEARLLMVYRLEQNSHALFAYMGECFNPDSVFWTEARCAVLANMAYNLGFSGLMQFKKMLEALKEEDAEAAAAEMLDSVWADQVGYRAKELALQMRTGEYPEKYLKASE